MRLRNSNKYSEIEFEHLSKKMSGLSSVDLMEEGSGESPSNDSQRMDHQMTILYDGKIGAYDVTELQARAILLLASNETERRMRMEGNKSGVGVLPLPAWFQHRLCIPIYGVSMKGSLQRFLQKRKLRAQARMPC